jgi:signal transduction histidine kinase/ligand-binding sensor domain-containing protein
MRPPCCHIKVIILLWLLKAYAISAQDINFERVNLPDKDAQDAITGITQDLKGNIWFTSWSGLFEYDGLHLKSYTHESLNPSSLATNNTECVRPDSRGNIWIGTYGDGLEKLDPATGVFVHYKHDAKDTSSISGDSVTCILQDNAGMLWIGTNHAGLNRFDTKTGKSIHYKHNDRDSTSLSFDQVRALYEDREGTLWVGTGSAWPRENPDSKGGLNRFNKNSNSFTRYLHSKNDPHSLSDDRVRAIYEDTYGNFWVGAAGDGLQTMDRATGSFIHYNYDPGHPEKLSRPPLSPLSWVDDHITFITEDETGAIWIGAFTGGLVRYDPRSKTVGRYLLDSAHENNSNVNVAFWAFTSRDGEMWVSNYQFGIFKLDPSHQNVRKITTKGVMQALVEESDSIQWIGTTAGLARVNKKNNDTVWFRHDAKNVESISNDTINVLRKDRQNRIWVGTQNGLSLFNPHARNFTSWLHNKNVSSGLINSAIFDIYEDNKSDLWIGTGGGLDKKNLATKTFTHYKAHPQDTAAKNAVGCILEDDARNLWIGNYNGGGLNLLNRETGAFKHYLAGKTINASYQDSEGKLWAGAAEGLYEYGKTSDSFYLFIDPTTRATVLSVRSIVEDNEKNLWVASSENIYRISAARNEVTKVGKDFGVTQELSFLAGFKDRQGQLIFGTIDGYYLFSPASIIGNSKPPEINLTDFAIGDDHLKIGDIATTKQITLNHRQNSFALSFNVIHYANPEANTAIYMLENYDKDWRPAGSERVAYYYNVPPGHYVFRIKAASSYGVWAEKDITITVNAPWWRTWWAYCVYALLFIALVVGVDRFQKARILHAERERARERELVQAKEIEKAYHELRTTQAQLIQSEKMASLGELTAGIAHEIQNPLNFVNNFSEVNKELLAEMKDEMDKGNIEDAKTIADDVIENQEKINLHGKRADSIVKGMLQHSRASSGQKEPTDINKLADEYLRLSYHGMRAKDKSFNAEYKTDFDETIGKINVVPQDIGRVLLNIINNAFYAVNEKGKNIGSLQPDQSSSFVPTVPTVPRVPTVTIVTKKLNNKIEIKVSDDGNGIPQKVVDKIFQPFFTTKPTGQGTGLGLSLAYDIIKAHGGEIKVNTREGEGSEFVIQLPIV